MKPVVSGCVFFLRLKMFPPINSHSSPCLVCVRRKSKQALRDYKKVQIQLENLETSVRDRCKKEFTGEDWGRIGCRMEHTNQHGYCTDIVFVFRLARPFVLLSYYIKPPSSNNENSLVVQGEGSLIVARSSLTNTNVHQSISLITDCHIHLQLYNFWRSLSGGVNDYRWFSVDVPWDCNTDLWNSAISQQTAYLLGSAANLASC